MDTVAAYEALLGIYETDEDIEKFFDDIVAVEGEFSDDYIEDALDFFEELPVYPDRVEFAVNDDGLFYIVIDDFEPFVESPH